MNVLEVPETNVSQEVSPHSIDLDVTVGEGPITRGKNHAVTVVAPNSRTGKDLDRVFVRFEIKDPIGTIMKIKLEEGNLTRTFKIGDNGIGTFTISATVSQAGVESSKSLTFQVQ